MKGDPVVKRHCMLARLIRCRERRASTFLHAEEYEYREIESRGFRTQEKFHWAVYIALFLIIIGPLLAEEVCRDVCVRGNFE